MRQETLPLAYSHLVFRMNDIDSLIEFLIAVGRVGRDNIVSLELPWKSMADAEDKWEKAPDSDPFLTLPALHATRCAQLLQQCKRLKSLRLRLERGMMDIIPLDVFKLETDSYEHIRVGGTNLCGTFYLELVGKIQTP